MSTSLRARAAADLVLAPGVARGALALVAAATLARTGGVLWLTPWSPRPWLTVLATVVLLAGALAAGRNRTWGLLLTIPSGVAFAGVAIVGVAPWWFAVVPGLVAVTTVQASSVWRRHPTAMPLTVGAAACLGSLAAALAGPVLPWLLGWA